jgi:acyl-CoA reductase-like NAD-dependent aldehyde dehydrogenase
MTTRIYQNLIGGKWVNAETGKTFLNHNPANVDDVVGEFQSSGPADVDRAVQAARAAYSHWRLVPAPKRGEILYRTGELLLRHKENLARQMTREMGKVLSETRGDVQEAADTAFYMAGEGRRLFGQTTPSELRDKFAMSVRMPVGVCGMITPWNFPMAIPSWKLFPALRQYLRNQAGGRYSVIDLQPGGTVAGSWLTGRGGKHCDRLWSGCRRAFGCASRGERHFLHWLE